MTDESAQARLRDLTGRLGYGDGVTEPMADNDTIVREVESARMAAADYQELQTPPITCDECYQRILRFDDLCDEHDLWARLRRGDEAYHERLLSRPGLTTPERPGSARGEG
jgi:hypothetical protein